MKITKRILTIVISLALVFGGIGLVSPKVASADADFSITSPTDGQLKAAGYIDITWESASNIGDVANYDVFIDGSLVETTTETKYEFYTNKVYFHKAWIRANFKDGTYHYCKTVRFGVTKKGIAISSGMGGYVAKINQLNIAWYYNWSPNPTNATRYKGLEFVPMIWGDKDASAIQTKMSNAINGGYKYILGFNEPDMGYDGGGCNMDTSVAIDLWPNFTMYWGQIKIGSPAYASWGSGSKMVQFMAGVENKVDYVCLHCYPWNWNGGESMAKWMLESVVDDAYNRYGKPIWITEYSTTGEEGHITQEGTAEFIEYFLKGLDEREYVERQSFFSFNADKPGGGLWSYSTGDLSQAGEAYRDNGNPTTDYKTGDYVNPRDDEPTTETTTTATTTSAPTTTTAPESSTPTTKAPTTAVPTKVGPTVKPTNKPTTKKKVKKPGKAKIKKAKYKKKRKIYLKLKKVKGAKGYQLKYSDAKNFDGYWTKNTKKTKVTLKKLDKNTKYYIKVRAYKLVDNAKLYGKWSKKKKVKVKK